MTGWVWGAILRLLPLERYLPGGGKNEVTPADLNRASSISIRRSHNADFYKKHSIFEKKSSVIEDKSLKTNR